ncbi:MAG: hypothetical protein IPF84_11860 [Proteobacteria bacterium]|nr:hypothetical protein [Pseudomonadota bacterium]
MPGQPLLVGLRLVPSGGWYSYWQVPGDAGLPTQIAWQLPPGFSAGPIEWPHPQRLPLGPMVNFGYKTETMLLTTLSVPQNLATGGSVTVRAEAKADWLECKDVCIPNGATLSLTLPVRESCQTFCRGEPVRGGPRAGSGSRWPAPEAQATLDGKRLRLALALPSDRRMDRVEFYPLEEARIEPSAAQILAKREGTQTAVYLTAATAAAPDFKTLKGVIVANGGPAVPNGWTATVEAPVSAGAVAASAFETAGKDPVGSSASMTLLIAFGGALLGGLILNLMPCVFPVLSLKLIGLSKHRTQSGPLAAHGLAFTAGVVLSFVLLAALLLALQQTGQALGWGFQLQTPWVIAALTVLFFVIGLNLLSVFGVHVRAGRRQLAGGRRAGAQVRLARQFRHRRAGGDRRFAVHGAVHGCGARVCDHATAGYRDVGLRGARRRYGAAVPAADTVSALAGPIAAAGALDGDLQAVDGVSDVRDLRLAAVGADAAGRCRRGRAGTGRYGGRRLRAVGAWPVSARRKRVPLGGPGRCSGRCIDVHPDRGRGSGGYQQGGARRWLDRLFARDAGSAAW